MILHTSAASEVVPIGCFSHRDRQGLMAHWPRAGGPLLVLGPLHPFRLALSRPTGAGRGFRRLARLIPTGILVVPLSCPPFCQPALNVCAKPRHPAGADL